METVITWFYTGVLVLGLFILSFVTWAGIFLTYKALTED